MAIGQRIADMWTRVTRGSSVNALQISEDDIVVFVVGPTGSGKSWFTLEATKSDLVNASLNYRPSTGAVQAIRCRLTDEARKDLQGGLKNVIFVDTPSFLTGYDEPDARAEFEKWFKKTAYKPRPEYVGVIYMHRIENDPLRETPIQTHVKEFTSTFRTCGAYCNLPRRFHIVKSYSSKLMPDKINEHSMALEAQVDPLEKLLGKKPSIHKDLFQGEPKVAWSAVAELFRD